MCPNDGWQLPLPLSKIWLTSSCFLGGIQKTASTDGVILQDMSSSYNANNNGDWKSKATLIESTSQFVAVTIDDIAILLHNNHHCTDHVLLFDGHKVKEQTTSGTTCHFTHQSRGL
jgi:hypothetical protein